MQEYRDVNDIYVYHVVTERPMALGQRLIFDSEHRNGVHRRVNEKLGEVSAIYAHPEKYDASTLEHHTSVALRELAMEQIRIRSFSQYPSRMACLYVSEQLEEALKWAELFIGWGRPTYQIVKMRVNGRCFRGDANNCFRGCTDQEENFRLALRYWENLPNLTNESPIIEMLVDGEIEVVEIMKEFPV